MALAAAPLPGRRKAETVAGRQPEGLSKGTDTECLTSIVCPARAAVCVCVFVWIDQGGFGPRGPCHDQIVKLGRQLVSVRFTTYPMVEHWKSSIKGG